MSKYLLAVFDEDIRVINHSISSYRHDGGEGEVTAESQKEKETMIAGDAQAVMEIIGHVSRSGHNGLRLVFGMGGDSWPQQIEKVQREYLEASNRTPAKS